MPVVPASTSDLIDLIRKSGLTLAIPDPGALPAEPQKAAGILVQKGVITRFQAQQLLLGRHKGFRLGAYIILEQIGRGGMGVVYMAEHQELRRKVAIKILVVAKDEDARLAAERFFREARAAAALDHPNIVRIFDVCRHNDTPYLVMEYVEGETLQQALDREGALPYAAAADAAAQAAAGLQHAHEKGFVHRDIKPGNLMRDRTGVVKILDMGLARASANAEDKLTERLDAGAVVGTADFIAPEQALNSPSVDIRADIYSLGATFFALVTGKPPFQGNTTQKLLQHQMAAAPSLATIDATLPKGLAGVTAKMLAKKPQERFQTPAEVIAALAPWLGNSARVLAGLSRTNLAAGADLHARLHEKAESTGRLRGASESAISDSGIVDAADPAAETGSVASAKTARSEPSRPPGRPAPKPARRVPLVPVAAGVVAAVAAAAGLAYALGAISPEPAREQAKTPPALPPVAPLSSGSQKAEPTPPPVEPRKVEPRKAEPPVTVEPAVAYRLKLGGLRPFTTRGSSEGNGEKGRDLRYVEAARTGDGDFPTGWAGQTWDQGAEAEFSIGTQAGRTALGARNIQKRSAFLISPDVTFQSPAAHIRFQYLTRAVGEKIVLLKFKVPGHDNTTGLFEIGHFPGTGGEWRTADLTVPLRGHSTVFFEWHTFDEGDDAGVFLAAFEAADEQAMGAEPVLGRFDFTRPAPFAIRSTIDIRPDGSHATRQLSRTGAGEPPPGWSARCWSKDTQMEFFADGTPGIGIRNVRGPGSAMLFSPTLAVPSGLCRVRAEYTAPVRDGLWSIRFKPSGNRNAWDASRPPATAPGEWKTAEFVFDTKGATAGFFEFHSHDVNPDNPVRIRSLVVTQPPAGTPPTPANAPAMVGAAAAAGRPAGPRVYQFEAASVPAFRVTKENSTRTAGEPEQLPRGVYCGCWKKEATGEFRREEVDGAPAFGLANFTEQMSAQFGFELEQPDGLALTLRPGGYRVRLVYMTRAEAHGQVDVQTQDYKTVGRVDLPATGGAWRTATFDFDRAADAPVRLTVDNLSAGEGNTLYFRALEVVELSQ